MLYSSRFQFICLGWNVKIKNHVFIPDLKILLLSVIRFLRATYVTHSSDIYYPRCRECNTTLYTENRFPFRNVAAVQHETGKQFRTCFHTLSTLIRAVPKPSVVPGSQLYCHVIKTPSPVGHCLEEELQVSSHEPTPFASKLGHRRPLLIIRTSVDQATSYPDSEEPENDVSTFD